VEGSGAALEAAARGRHAAGDHRGDLVSVGGHCGAHYAGILVHAGEWDAAEAEVRRAMELLVDRATLRESALCRLADLRLRQGRLEDAEALLAGLGHHEDAVVPIARLHLELGRPALAVEFVDRCLSVDGRPDHVEAPLLAVTMGIVEWLTHDLDPDARPRAFDQLRATVEAHERPDGVAFGSSAWLVTARRHPAP
jgi:hypothetical protein